MSKKLKIHGYRVIVEIPCEHYPRGNYTPAHAAREAGEISRAIKRHLSPYHKDCEQMPGIYQDAEYVCEYCGSKWAEGKDSEHNGGCCDRDTEILRAIEKIEEEEAREKALENGQFGAGA